MFFVAFFILYPICLNSPHLILAGFEVGGGIVQDKKKGLAEASPLY
jgi:hypothetical protein